MMNMILYTKIQGNEDGKEGQAFLCTGCGTFITYSDAMVRINGAENHSFLNPAGVRCNFTTFANCENVLVHDRLHTEHSWFPGYGWRFLLCSACSQHLGWKYDAVRPATRPRAFFGVLFDAVRVDPDQE